MLVTFPNDIIGNLVNGIILGYGAFQVLDGATTIGALIAFMAFTPRAYQALRGVLATYTGTQRAHASIELVDDLVGRKIEVLEDSSQALGEGVPGVTFDRVSFHHDRGFGFTDLTFSVEPGEFLGIVGPSGGGKSTIFDLLLRFYEPETGTIRVGDVDHLRLSTDELRQTIVWIPQDVFLWNGSLTDNLAYPDRHTPGDLDRPARLCGLDIFAEKQPEGYDTQVGQGGILLSGGERQRIALVRALLKDARILLLDESTPALDALSELQIQGGDRNRPPESDNDRHRPSTLQHADRILVLDENARIAEISTMAELLSHDGLFKKLWSAQSLDT